MSSEPLAARLISSATLGPGGGGVCRLADIDGDGKREFVTLQTAGHLKAECKRGHDLGVDDVDRTLHCLTALTLDGRVLWQDGRPYDRDDLPFVGHGGGHMLVVEDVNADGRPEAIVIRGQELAVLDGATGETLNSTQLPSDNIVCAFTAQLGDPAHGRQIVCKVTDQSYPPWEYANPIVIYNADLSVRAEPFAVRGAGHNIVALDVDGDGRDELFIGYSLLDHTLEPIWELDLGPEFDYARDHADSIAVSDLDGDGELEVRFAGSEDFYVVDMEGNIKSTTRAGHSQASVEGEWGPGGERRIIMCEKNRGIWGLDVEGDVLWNRTDINGYAKRNVRWSSGDGPRSWAIFKPNLRPFKETPYESDPSWSRGLWPSLMCGDGHLHDVLPWRDEYAQPARSIRSRRSYDAGVGYGVIVSDLDDDGFDEIVVHDRDRLEVFHVDL